MAGQGGWRGKIQRDSAMRCATWGAKEFAQNVVIADFTLASGYEKTGDILNKCAGLDGLVCATDAMAVGAMRYLREHDSSPAEDSGSGTWGF